MIGINKNHIVRNITVVVNCDFSIKKDIIIYKRIASNR